MAITAAVYGIGSFLSTYFATWLMGLMKSDTVTQTWIVPAVIFIVLADTLAGLLVAQLTNPGTPFIASKFNDNLDMNTAAMAHSRPELIIAQCATSNVFRYLGLSFCSNFGSTDNGCLNQLAAFDKAVQIYSALLSGVNMVFSLNDTGQSIAL